MGNDYTIAVGSSRQATTWRNTALTLEDFINRLRSPVVTPESMADYAAMSHALRAEKKDVGGYVAGSLKDGKRKADSVSWRSMVTLDLDNVDVSTDKALDTLRQRCPYMWICHPSHSHRDNAPRLRLIVPLETPVAAEQYEPIARRIAADIDIDWFDVTTYQASRLMYWPSVPSDLDYAAVFTVHEGPLCAGNAVLDRYTDWRNVAEWPTASKEAELVKNMVRRQGDPLAKNNVVGEFCRTYTISEAIEKFLSDEYAPTNKEDRYTYTGGSTVGGLVIYDGVFAYDNHATSPASGQLCNAFDLVRVHRFIAMDASCKKDTDTTKRPSYQAMVELAGKDAGVLATRAQERAERINEFTFEIGDNAAPKEAEPAEAWEDKLVLDKNGLVASTIKNVYTIMTHDQSFAGHLYADTFAGRDMVIDPLPWTTADADSTARDWSDKDTDNLRMYLEECYGISSKDKIETGLNTAFSSNSRHPVREYLQALPPWDGVRRAETALIDYLGAEDTQYTRTVTLKHLVAAVARVMQPGIKYDTMITLSGKQGLGKSTFIRMLCGNDWFDDSLREFKGKEPFEIIQGRWMVEIGELSAYKKADKEVFKAFMSKVSDTYRPAYGRRTVHQKRQCIFWGTTNDAQFLRDETGDRRTWPVAVGETVAIKDVFSDLPAERDQIWAEVLALYRDGYSIALTPEEERMAEEVRAAFTEENPMRDKIVSYLNEEIPADWSSYGIIERSDWLNGVTDREGVQTKRRERVTALEVWVECFEGSPRNFDKRSAGEINLILANLEGWRKDQKLVRLSKEVYGGVTRKLSFVRE